MEFKFRAQTEYGPLGKIFEPTITEAACEIISDLYEMSDWTASKGDLIGVLEDGDTLQRLGFTDQDAVEDAHSALEQASEAEFLRYFAPHT